MSNAEQENMKKHGHRKTTRNNINKKEKRHYSSGTAAGTDGFPTRNQKTPSIKPTAIMMSLCQQRQTQTAMVAMETVNKNA